MADNANQESNATTTSVEASENTTTNTASASKSDSSDLNKIFIGGLSWDTTEDGLQKHFGKYGNIIDCIVMKEPMTQRSRGFGFITFSDAAGLQGAMSGGPHTLDGRTVEVKKAQPKGERGGLRTKKIFVGGIAQTTTEETIRTYFGQYGTIEEILLMKDRNTDRPRGFGFVTFDSEDVVDQLVQRRWHDIDNKQVEIKKAEPRMSERPGMGMARGAMGYGGYRDDWGYRAPRESGYGAGYGYAQGGYGGGYGQGGYGGAREGGYGGAYGGRDAYGGAGYGPRGAYQEGYSAGYGGQGGSYGGGNGYDGYGAGGYSMGQYGNQGSSSYGPATTAPANGGSGGYGARSYHPYSR